MNREHRTYTPEDRAKVFKLLQQGMSAVDIARTVGMPPGTIYGWIHEAEHRRPLPGWGEEHTSSHTTASFREACVHLRDTLLEQASELDEVLKTLDSLDKIEQMALRAREAAREIDRLKSERDRLVQQLGQRALAVGGEHSLTGKPGRF